jgi:hypothetical protein
MKPDHIPQDVWDTMLELGFDPQDLRDSAETNKSEVHALLESAAQDVIDWHNSTEMLFFDQRLTLAYLTVGKDIDSNPLLKMFSDTQALLMLGVALGYRIGSEHQKVSDQFDVDDLDL